MIFFVHWGNDNHVTGKENEMDNEINRLQDLPTPITKVFSHVENFTLLEDGYYAFLSEQERSLNKDLYLLFLGKQGIDDPKELLVAGQFNKMKIDQIWGSWSFKLYEPHFHRVETDEEKIIGGYVLDCLRKFHQKKIGET